MKKFGWLALLIGMASVSAGASAPTEGLKTLDGQSASYAPTAKNVLLVFWATWCSDCKSKMKGELPEMAKRPDLDIVLVNTESDAGRVKNFVEQEHLAFRVLMDSDKTLRKSLKAFSVPHWALYKKGADGSYSLASTQPAFDRGKIEGML